MLWHVQAGDHETRDPLEIFAASSPLHANQHPPKTAINCRRSITLLPHPFFQPNPARRGCCCVHWSFVHTIPVVRDLSVQVLLVYRVPGNISNAECGYFLLRLYLQVFRAHIDGSFPADGSASRLPHPDSPQPAISSRVAISNLLSGELRSQSPRKPEMPPLM